MADVFVSIPARLTNQLLIGIALLSLCKQNASILDISYQLLVYALVVVLFIIFNLRCNFRSRATAFWWRVV